MSSSNSEKQLSFKSNKKRGKPWSSEEDKILIEKSTENNFKNWSKVASFLKGRTAIQCSARYKRIKPGLTKGAWTKEEDEQLLKLYQIHGKNWSMISKCMPQRTGKQIRDRFLNALENNLKKDKFTQDEDRKVMKYYLTYGTCWSKIASYLRGRTGDMVKNRFYSYLKNHLENYIDPETNTLLKRDDERTVCKNLLKRKRKRSKSTIKHDKPIISKPILDVVNERKIKKFNNSLRAKKIEDKNICSDNINKPEQNKAKEGCIDNSQPEIFVNKNPVEISFSNSMSNGNCIISNFKGNNIFNTPMTINDSQYEEKNNNILSYNNNISNSLSDSNNIYNLDLQDNDISHFNDKFPSNSEGVNPVDNINYDIFLENYNKELDDMDSPKNMRKKGELLGKIIKSNIHSNDFKDDELDQMLNILEDLNAITTNRINDMINFN